MANIYEALKGLITSELISKAAKTLGESSPKVGSAVSALIPSLLGRLIKEGDSPRVRDVINMAGENKVLSRIGEIFEGHGVVDGVNYGERFENALVGSVNKEFPKAIAAKSGISSDNADRLSNWVSATIAAYLGNKMVVEHNGYSSILAEIGMEKDSIKAGIPAGILSTLGLSSIFGATAKPAIESKVAQVAAKTKREIELPKNKKSYSWLWWLLLLPLLALLFCWWRSCDRKKDIVVPATALTGQISSQVAAVNNMVTNADGTVSVTLPDGKVINIKKSCCEDHLYAYLNSDEFKNASADDLKNKWFDFDHIDFKHASSSEMTDGSYTQLDNITAILKAYPTTKIKVGGYADKTGSNLVNQEISEERAKFIKSVFEKNGIDAARVSTVGFGESYATHPVNAPDSLRVLDRHIALRFDK